MTWGTGGSVIGLRLKLAAAASLTPMIRTPGRPCGIMLVGGITP